MYETYCTYKCAGLELPVRIERCRPHRGKIKLTLGEARKLVSSIGGRYYRCPFVPDHWHRTSQEKNREIPEISEEWDDGQSWVQVEVFGDE